MNLSHQHPTETPSNPLQDPPSPTHLTGVVPLRVNGVVDGLGLELLGSKAKNAVRVRLPHTHEPHVLLHQVFGLYDVDSKDALRRRSGGVNDRSWE